MPIGGASGDIDQRIRLYKNENAVDQQVTFTPVRFTGALTNVTLNVKADSSGLCESGPSQWAGSRTWLKGDLHQATFGQPSWWTGTTGKDGLILAWTLTVTTTQTPAKLDTHPGGEKCNSPLSRQGNEAIVANNRKVICDSTFNPVPNGMTASGTKPSCDEYPFASSRQSGGGTVTSGSQCAQFYVVKNGTRWSLEYDTRSSLPTWKELAAGSAGSPRQCDCTTRTSTLAYLDSATAASPRVISPRTVG